MAGNYSKHVRLWVKQVDKAQVYGDGRLLVAGNCGIDGAGPGIDAASEGLGVAEALFA